MPRRWISVRGQKDKDVTVVTDQFDFEFVTASQDPDSPLTPAKSKTNMFNSPSFRVRKSKGDVQPQSSSSSKFPVDKRLQLTKVEDSWIGVAFGSPTHPPTSLFGLFDNDNTISFKQPNRNEASLSASPVTMGKYRKFSNLFKSKSNQISISAPTHVYKIDGDQKLGMPIATKPWTNPTSPPDWIHSDNLEAFTTTTTHSVVVSNTVPDAQRPIRTTLPKLEIQIPNLQLDRYSVMFEDVQGIKPSSLLERRSRNLNNLRLTQKEAESAMPPVPPLKPSQLRRPTTPQHHRRKSSSYSLFPSPPKPRKSNDIPERNLPRRKLSFSSRPTPVPDQSCQLLQLDAPSIHRPATPQRKESELSVTTTSPDDTVASSERDDSPWRSRDSLQSIASSRTSMGSEIFFDLKPACDADGREQSQYIIHEPDSPAMERAISESRKARKAKRREEVVSSRLSLISPDLQAAEHFLQAEERWRLSMELNQAIAEVERLTSPLGAMTQPTESHEIVIAVPKPPPKDLLPSVRLRKKFDTSAIGIPSPITERSEEFSPRVSPPTKHFNPLRSHPRPHIASLSIKPAPLNISDEELEIIEDFAITPPPVPVKDAKFIPISRFAANSPSVKIVEHRPKRHKPKRTVTDSSILPLRTDSMRQRKAIENQRPATLDSIPTRHADKQIVSPNASKRIESGIVAVSVKPAAEVSIARTISLERQHSQQVLVPGQVTHITDLIMA